METWIKIPFSLRVVHWIAIPLKHVAVRDLIQTSYICSEKGHSVIGNVIPSCGFLFQCEINEPNKELPNYELHKPICYLGIIIVMQLWKCYICSEKQHSVIGNVIPSCGFLFQCEINEPNKELPNHKPRKPICYLAWYMGIIIVMQLWKCCNWSFSAVFTAIYGNGRQADGQMYISLSAIWLISI